MVEHTVFTAEEAATGVEPNIARESFCPCGFRWKERDGTVTDLADLRNSHLQHIERWLLGVGATIPAGFNAHSYRHIVEEMIWRQLETLPVHPNSQLRREAEQASWNPHNPHWDFEDQAYIRGRIDEEVPEDITITVYREVDPMGNARPGPAPRRASIVPAHPSTDPLQVDIDRNHWSQPVNPYDGEEDGSMTDEEARHFAILREIDPLGQEGLLP